MDYEQDYSKLNQSNNNWYTRRSHLVALTNTPDEEPASSTTLTLDNEDFN